MSLSDIAVLANLVSAVAVLGTLVHLTLQLRQADRNQRAVIQQGLAAHVTQLMMRAADPGLAGVLTRAREGERLSPTETTQLVSFLRAALVGFQDGYLHQRSSLSSRALLELQERHMRWLLSMPAYRRVWEAQKEMFAPEFATYVDALIASLPAEAGPPRPETPGSEQPAPPAAAAPA